MLPGNRPFSLVIFFLKSTFLTLLIFLPVMLINKNYFAIKYWLQSNPYMALLFYLPGMIIIIYWLYHSVRGRL
jgi:hypothetical protein